MLWQRYVVGQGAEHAPIDTFYALEALGEVVVTARHEARERSTLVAYLAPFQQASPARLSRGSSLLAAAIDAATRRC